MMLYNTLKIIHVLSAGLLLTSLIYCIRLWLNSRVTNDKTKLMDRIQLQTWLGIVPFALIQLMTGFTIISIKHYDYTALWVIVSAAGFMIVILSWFGFMYCLGTRLRWIQVSCLGTCGVTLLCMLFFMASRVEGLS